MRNLHAAVSGILAGQQRALMQINAHDGTTVSGAFAQTMVLTDVATGWTECIPSRRARDMWVREAEMVVHALERARAVPVPLLGVDFDNDSPFMNDLVVGWCPVSFAHGAVRVIPAGGSLRKGGGAGGDALAGVSQERPSRCDLSSGRTWG